MGVYTVLYWTITGSSQISIYWMYRFVCSGYVWAKALLNLGSILAVSGWVAFTVCDSINLAWVIQQSNSGSMLAGYFTFETASMILENLAWFMIGCIQIARLHHIRKTVMLRPWLVFIPITTFVTLATGVLRLVYFRQHGMFLKCGRQQLWLTILRRRL